MWVKVPSTRLRYDSLSAYDDPTRFREVEALNWTQSDIRCGVTLGVNGEFLWRNRALKSDLVLSRTQHQNLTSLETNPAAHLI